MAAAVDWVFLVEAPRLAISGRLRAAAVANGCAAPRSTADVPISHARWRDLPRSRSSVQVDFVSDGSEAAAAEGCGGCLCLASSCPGAASSHSRLFQASACLDHEARNRCRRWFESEHLALTRDVCDRGRSKRGMGE